jgi:hypothetical protein
MALAEAHTPTVGPGGARTQPSESSGGGGLQGLRRLLSAPAGRRNNRKKSSNGDSGSGNSNGKMHSVNSSRMQEGESGKVFVLLVFLWGSRWTRPIE